MNDKEIALHLLKMYTEEIKLSNVYLSEDGIRSAYKEFYDFIKTIDKEENKNE